MTYVHGPRGELTRLPKWAQEYVSDLQAEIRRQEKHITEISSEHAGSNVTLDTKIGRPAVTLPANSTVQFYLGSSRDLDDVIEVHHNRLSAAVLDVTAYGGSFAMYPRSGNSVSLRLDQRWP